MQVKAAQRRVQECEAAMQGGGLYHVQVCPGELANVQLSLSCVVAMDVVYSYGQCNHDPYSYNF